VALWVACTLAALAALLVAEARGSRAGAWIAKPAASTGFVATALAGGALSSSYGRWVLLALALGWLGDVLLIPHDRRAFTAGLLSFLLGHLAFAVAFLVRGIALGWAVVTAAVLVPPARATLRWLQPHVPAAMQAPVRAYVGVICAMVACAVGTVTASWRAAILGGAVMFFVSDLSVARNRFVAPGFDNKLWGLPLYYGGQLLLAASVAVT
jgi:uncharacterized membrane protein YhhN